VSVAETIEPLPPLVADAMVLIHFAKADRLDVLGTCLSSLSTTRIVAAEVDKYCAEYPSITSISDLEWLAILPQDTLEELLAFERWVQLLGSGEHDLGEASVFAAAEVHELVAITDDRDATRVGSKHGLEIHGTVWLLTRLHQRGKRPFLRSALWWTPYGRPECASPAPVVSFLDGPKSAGCSSMTPDTVDRPAPRLVKVSDGRSARTGPVRSSGCRLSP